MVGRLFVVAPRAFRWEGDADLGALPAAGSNGERRADQLGTFASEHFREFFLNPYFPSIPAIDLARFPDPDALCAELTGAGFEAARAERFDQPVTASATDVAERVRGRYISTLRLLDEDEYRSGLTRLEADIAAGRDRFDYTLRWALVTAIAGSGPQLRVRSSRRGAFASGGAA